MDKIKITDLEVYARHGVYPEEKALGQKFLVSIVMETQTRQAGLSDSLSDSVDYGHVAHYVESFLTEHTYKLLEAAAEHLAEALLLHYHILAVTVELKKPWAPVLLPLQDVSVEIRRQWHHVYLSIGSNIGDREQHLKRALEYLQQDSYIRVGRISDFIVTEPYGYTEQEEFLNGAVEIFTLYAPAELLRILHAAEEDGGRKRLVHWGPRTVDLDILFYDDIIVAEPDLIIPHPEIAKRAFVLEPMSQIAPWFVHPALGKSIVQMWEQLKEIEIVERCENT